MCMARPSASFESGHSKMAIVICKRVSFFGYYSMSFNMIAAFPNMYSWERLDLWKIKETLHLHRNSDSALHPYVKYDLRPQGKSASRRRFFYFGYL